MANFKLSTSLNDNFKGPKKPRIGILGGGVIGVICAEKISKQFNDVDIVLMSDKFSPHTTGDVAAGLWGEYLSGSEQNLEKLYKWLKESYDAKEELYFGQESALAGIAQLSGYRFGNKAYEPVFWKDIVHGFRHLTRDELLQFGDDYKFGLSYLAYTAECPKLLPYFMHRFSERSGKIFKLKADTLNELIGKFDVLINCTGIDASYVVPDPSVIPIRGQIIKVKAPWIKTFMLDEVHGNYIIPNIDSVILGGTSQRGNYSLDVNSTDANKIWKGCSKLLPSIQDSKFLSHHVGLRPGRHCIRLERDTLFKNNAKMEVIHNYGHGGCGISVAWGCASEVVTHLNEFFKSGHKMSAKL